MEIRYIELFAEVCDVPKSARNFVGESSQMAFDSVVDNVGRNFMAMLGSGVLSGIHQARPSTYGSVSMAAIDMIVGGDFQIIADDRVVQTAGEQKFNYLATPLFQYKNYLFGWGGSYGVDNRSVYLLTSYLATINNLDGAVVKTSDQTMRIMYTLEEE